MAPATLPILLRAWRTQWRDGRAFALLLAVAGALAALLVWRYGAVAGQVGQTDSPQPLRAVGETLWHQSAWLQTLVVLLIAPALTAGSIARERERGLLESLQMAPLSPLQIALEKWASALGPLLLMLGAVFPLNLILVLSGGASLRELLALTAFSLACAAGGAALGLGASAWAWRTHLALRSAYGLVILWLLSSGASALAASETALRVFIGPVPDYVKWWGRTNAILAANDLVAGAPLPAKWPYAVLLLLLLTLFCLGMAARALRRPLGEAPFIPSRRARPNASNNSSPNAALAISSGYFEVPFAGALRFANPVMGREVASKFRLRQPPLGVIVFEWVLALAVLFFYARTLGVALLDPGARQIIFWGVSFTGLSVSLIACGTMGANALAREHEDGGWAALRLSLLRPREIIAGKVGGILLTCALFSVPVWPLLLPCVSWPPRFAPMPYSGQIAPSQLVAVVAVWLGSMSAATLWGMWLGTTRAQVERGGRPDAGHGSDLDYRRAAAGVVGQLQPAFTGRAQPVSGPRLCQRHRLAHQPRGGPPERPFCSPCWRSARCCGSHWNWK